MFSNLLHIEKLLELNKVCVSTESGWIYDGSIWDKVR